MASKKSPDAMEFIVAALKKNPKVEYASVKEAAEKKKLTVYPIMYGRAKALLGLVPVAPRGSKKAKQTTAKRGPGRPRKIGRRGPGRPRKERSPLDSLENMISDMKNVARERDSYRSTLEKIAQLLDSTF